MTSPATAFRHRKPNRAERRAALSRRAAGKLATAPRQKAGAAKSGHATNPYTDALEMDAVTHPERLRPTT